MDDYHRDLERKMLDLRNQVHDRFEDVNHPTARLISNQLKQIENAAQNNDNLRSIEDHMKVVQQQLRQSQHLPTEERVMTVENSTHFYDFLEKARMDIRKQSHY